MGKINLNKLKLFKRDDNYITTTINGQDIEVKQYLPVEDKLSIIQAVLTYASDTERPYFYDPGRYDVYMALQMILYYTNISITEKQMENSNKIYDILAQNGVIDIIMEMIPAQEYRTIQNWAKTVMKEIGAHAQSALGILESIAADYSNLNLDADAIKEKIADPNNIAFLKEIMPLMDNVKDEGQN